MATTSVIANTTSNTINAGSAAAAASVVVTSTLNTRKRTYETAIAMPAMDTKELNTKTTIVRTKTSTTATTNGAASSSINHQENGLNAVVFDLGEPQAATTLRDSTRTVSQSDADDGGEAASPDDTLPSASTAASSSADYLNGSAGVKRKYVVPSVPSFLGSGASDFAVS